MHDFLFYVKLGWDHIISKDALDHQLFILALLLPFSFREYRQLLVLITAFTIGHCITLVLSVLNILVLPSKYVEFFIPLTIVITALEAIFAHKKVKKYFKYNYILALVFGLVHGLGFANTARVMISQDQSVLVPMLGFNIGLELGQITILIIYFMLMFLLTNVLKIPEKALKTLLLSLILFTAISMALDRFSSF